MRYSEIRDAVGYSTTATRALKSTEKNGILKREVLDEPYRPVCYSLTDKGRKLTGLLRELENMG